MRIQYLSLQATLNYNVSSTRTNNTNCTMRISILETTSTMTGAVLEVYQRIVDNLHFVNIINIILFALLGVGVAALSHTIYIGYKQALLRFQTFVLRNQCSPLCYVWRKCISLFVKNDSEETAQHQPKGLVGVIAIDIEKVEPSTIKIGSKLKEIHFAEKDGNYIGRNTQLPDDVIKEECVKIQEYYKALENELDKTNPIFKYEGKHLCECFRSIYSLENINKAIKKTNEEINSNNAVHFIGDKIGVCGYDLSEGNLTMDIYITDHFTWQVFKEIFKSEKSFFQEVILRINQANATEKKALVKLLAFLFSSFGVDIIIEGQDCRDNRMIIITARSGNIEKDGKGSLHVSVNETFSRTDSVENKEKYSLVECVKRGIEEEMGIPQTLITEDLIKFHDFAIVTDEGEIGLSCHVNLSDVMPVEKMMMYPGQDKFLENEELLMVPYFNVCHLDIIKSVDSPKFMRKFYTSTMNDRLSMPWMSFTPLLISRVMLRNIRFSIPAQLAVRMLLWISCFVIMSRILNHTLLGVLVIEQILGTTAQLLVETFWTILRRKSNSPYKFIQPLVAQWHGNAKVVQATGVTNPGAEEIRRGLTFDLSSFALHAPVKISELELSRPPHCSVRRQKCEGIYTEVPISQYQFKAHNPNADKNTLHFLSLNIWTDTNDTTIDIRFDYKPDSITKENKIVRISFIDEEDVIINNIAAPTDGLKNYELLDLFTYQQNFYWSCVKDPENKENDFEITDKSIQDKKSVKKFYDYVLGIIKNREKGVGSLTLRIIGPNKVIEQWLCNFTSHRNNKRRISELELYMLQFYLIRHDNKILADCVFKDRIRYKIYASSGI